MVLGLADVDVVLCVLRGPTAAVVLVHEDVTLAQDAEHRICVLDGATENLVFVEQACRRVLHLFG